ncbi:MULTISPECIES: MarR family winged helix-turn-helix transcriptional regulator [unclassified Arcicella]|uniref:MarR family winged helix-turn-helix transcriptional regulator n=1 Tax=unclassified Arcicella TaxID=2644986 RepID=UPI0028629471|nr:MULTISPECIES: MarR family winged helix-turn-helix transcriptional regulator [unclassified Arcicella]MDR6562186.1 DNA-binding MarR family transcriptional regulator [Arcicella sp. BE51]MDR6812119.1 DNA-binding MarR family transcriptional regulator [Arcicella sp. BE140]MDR6823431.1 DNA-binding MarR family transcriptional regulator [Arcicella sp. BE139]
MEKFELLKLLITKVEKYYDNEETSKSLDAFLIWLIIDNNRDSISFDKLHDKTDVENNIEMLNSLLHRYAKMYSKLVLGYSTNLSLEEFSFLSRLLSLKSCTKSELIDIMVYEKSTGLEIIKRLIKANLISEESNQSDKRSKQINLTDTGKKKLSKAFSQMKMVSIELTSILDIAERSTLYHILLKLVKYHRQHIDINIESLRKKCSIITPIS